MVRLTSYPASLPGLPGQTPLHPDEFADLIPGHITLKSELNEFEQLNIAGAVQKYLHSSKKWDLCDPEVLKKIHFDMLCDTWKWAGKYRQRDTNIGCDWRQIQVQVKSVCEDVKYWTEKKTISLLEAAVRFHHRLISIHPFPNGNGRHGRLIADIFLRQQGGTLLNWGEEDLTRTNLNSENYLNAMKAADRGELDLLLCFAQGKRKD